MWKDIIFEADHGTVSQKSKTTKVFHDEPISHGGRVYRRTTLSPVKGRVANTIAGAIQVGADEEENKK